MNEIKVMIRIEFDVENRTFYEGEIVTVNNVYNQPLKKCQGGEQKYMTYYIEKGTGAKIPHMLAKVI